MTIFRQAVNIPTVASSVANIGTYTGASLVGGIGKIPLNGSMVSSLTGQVSFISSGYASGMSIFSAANISSTNFTIIGTYNEKIITETIVGPNNNTVYTNNLFHTIISIGVTGIPIPPITQFTIGSNCNLAVVLTDGNSKMGESHSNYNYSILLNSITAAAPWVAGSAVAYGIAGTAPTSLQVNNLTYANRPSNYFALPITGAAPVATTVPQLNNGILYLATYPYAAVIVYLSIGANTTPVFVEITQS